MVMLMPINRTPGKIPGVLLLQVGNDERTLYTKTRDLFKRYWSLHKCGCLPKDKHKQLLEMGNWIEEVNKILCKPDNYDLRLVSAWMKDTCPISGKYKENFREWEINRQMETGPEASMSDLMHELAGLPSKTA
jgi:hypothetical protein